MPWKPGTSNPLALTLTVLRELRGWEEERVSVELARSILVYLQRARHDPQLPYQEVA
jgi:hypothetical protein